VKSSTFALAGKVLVYGNSTLDDRFVNSISKVTVTSAAWTFSTNKCVQLPFLSVDIRIRVSREEELFPTGSSAHTVPMKRKQSSPRHCRTLHLSRFKTLA
jgi:hypothetical protein